MISYIIAVDLGTTTIAMQLRRMDTGEIVDTYCAMNPQRKYGSDVLSRIQAACDGHGEILRRCVWEVLERGVAQFADSVGKASIKCICIAGNTTMEHLFMGQDVSSLGRSPFIPVEIGLQKCEGPSAIPIYITPGISTFVGGDIVAGMYALSMMSGTGEEQVSGKGLTERRGGVRLLIDLGTNGEMAITDGTDTLVTATAAGPAFEGGMEKAVVGTDMIAVTASLRSRGVLDETGLLAEPYFTQGVSIHTQKAILFLSIRISGHYRWLRRLSGPGWKSCGNRWDVPAYRECIWRAVSGIIWMWRRPLPLGFCRDRCGAVCRQWEIPH